VSQTTFPSLRNDAQVATDSTRLKSRLLSKARSAAYREAV
jgi:MFS family permease